MQDDEEDFLLSLSAEERTSILRRKEKEMDETDPLVRDTGGQEVQRKVLRFPGYRGKGMQIASLFLCFEWKIASYRHNEDGCDVSILKIKGDRGTYC